MIFFLLGKLHNLYMKIINSVVVVGLYYGFLTTFSIGSSYFLLIRAIATEKKRREGTVKRVAATTGFIMGQFILLLSIYSKPLYLLLGRPHTITALTLPYLLVHFFLSNHYDFDYDNSLHSFSTQLVFLNNLIFPLFYHFMLPSPMLARSANIYMFRCNNKIFFVISSFVSWLIGLILFIKYVDMLFVWIRQRGSIRSIIRSSKYLNVLLSNLYVLLSRFRSNKYLNQLIIRVRSNKQLYILLSRFRSKKSINVLLSRLRPSKQLVSDFKYLVAEFQYLMFELRKSVDRPFTIMLFFICVYSLGRAPSAFLTRKMRKPPITIKAGGIRGIRKTEKGYYPWWFEKHPVCLLFNYKRWTRPLRYIKNSEFETPVRNETSQHFFFSGQENGHLRVSFTYPSHLATFMEMLEHKMYLSFFSKENFVCDELDKFFCDELHHFDYWIHTNETKLCSLRNEFTDRIEALDIGSPYLDVLEKKIRLCNKKTKKEYLPKIYDPFLNGSYRGIFNQSFLPSILNQTEVKKCRKLAKLNKVHSILLFKDKELNVPNLKKLYHKLEEKLGQKIYTLDKKSLARKWSLLIDEFTAKSISNCSGNKEKVLKLLLERITIDHIIKTIYDTIPLRKKKTRKNPNPISKKVPRWPYRLVSDVGRLRMKVRKLPEAGKEPLPGFHLRWKTARRVVIYKDKEKNDKTDQNARGSENLLEFLINYSSSTNSKKEEKRREVGMIIYPNISDFRRNIITGSMRFQRRKAVLGRIFQVKAHSPLFFDIVKFYIQDFFDEVISRVIEISNLIQDIFRKITGIQLKNKRRSQRDEELEFSKSLNEELEKKDWKYQNVEERNLLDANQEELAKLYEEEQKKEKALDAYENIFFWADPSIARNHVLIVQSKIRKWILLPSLILAKNFVRLLLLQKTEWAEDIKDMKREVHIPCNEYDMPIPEEDVFSKTWQKEDTQMHIIIKNPFRLKPWHRSKRHRSKIQPSGRAPMQNEKEKRKINSMKNENYSYLTALGMETECHFGTSNQLLFNAFFYFCVPIFQKSKKEILKLSPLVLKMIKERTKFLKVPKELQKWIKGLSEIKKKDSIINNQIIHESSIQIRSMGRTNYSPTKKEIKMKDLTDKISKIRNEIKIITKDKKRTRKKNKSRNARLSRKSYFFLKWILERIYTDILLGIFPSTIKKIFRSIIKSLYRWMSIIKRFLKLKKKKKNLFERISTIQKKLSLSHITHKLRKRRKIRITPPVFFKLSLVSQAYVFYKLSENQAINLYKLRSGLQYDGASFFLKNEIKDSFRRQGIISSELKHKKLQNSGMNRWKNLLKKNQWIKWLKSHYQYELSERKWSKLGPQEWRSEVNQHCRGENGNFIKRKRNSSKREKKVLLLRNQLHLQKTYRYDKRSYQSINYNIHKPNLVDMGGSSPIQNYIRKDHFMKNTDRQFFSLFYLQINKDKEINPFDWMGMNEEIRNHTYSIPWLFPQFRFKKQEICQLKKKLEFRLIHFHLYSPLSEKKTIGQEDYTQDYTQSEMQVARKLEDEEFLGKLGFKCMRKVHLSCQGDWGDHIVSEEIDENGNEPGVETVKETKITRRGQTLFMLKKWAVDPNVMGTPSHYFRSFEKLIEEGLLTLEPSRVAVEDHVKLIMYQTIRISLIHEIQQKNKRDIDMDKNPFKVWIGQIMSKNRKKQNFYLLVPENILSSRRRRELRILSCLNARNSNGVDKNAVFCNGNRVKTCGQFLDKSQDLDRDKKNFWKFKFFLWPNYRFEDLACMNRYWFDTNNGSRFSMLRIHMYPRLNNGSLIQYVDGEYVFTIEN